MREESLVYWLRKLVFRGAWLDHRVKEGPARRLVGGRHGRLRLRGAGGRPDAARARAGPVLARAPVPRLSSTLPQPDSSRVHGQLARRATPCAEPGIRLAASYAPTERLERAARRERGLTSDAECRSVAALAGASSSRSRSSRRRPTRRRLRRVRTRSVAASSTSAVSQPSSAVPRSMSRTPAGVEGMIRIRDAYLELAPELEPCFVTSRYDDRAGLQQSAVTRARPTAVPQQFVSSPGVVATLDSVVAGAAAGIAEARSGYGTSGSLALGAVGSLLSIAGCAVWATRTIGAWSDGSTLASLPRTRVTEPSADYSTGVKPNARSASGAEISIDFTTPIGTIRSFGSSPSRRCGMKEKNPKPGSGPARRDEVARAVGELDPHLGLLEAVLLRERRDHPRDRRDQLVERAGGARASRYAGRSCPESLEEPARRRLRHRADVRAPELGDHAAARRALEEAELEEVRLVDVLDRVRLLAERDGERRQADRPAAELVRRSPTGARGRCVRARPRRPRAARAPRARSRASRRRRAAPRRRRGRGGGSGSRRAASRAPARRSRPPRPPRSRPRGCAPSARRSTRARRARSSRA